MQENWSPKHLLVEFTIELKIESKAQKLDP